MSYTSSCITLHLCTVAVVVTPNCSFPFTYNGGLYYGCIHNMLGTSTADQPFACINVNATPVVCDSPGKSLIIYITPCTYINLLCFARWIFAFCYTTYAWLWTKFGHVSFSTRQIAYKTLWDLEPDSRIVFAFFDIWKHTVPTTHLTVVEIPLLLCILGIETNGNFNIG